MIRGLNGRRSSFTRGQRDKSPQRRGSNKSPAPEDRAALTRSQLREEIGRGLRELENLMGSHILETRSALNRIESNLDEVKTTVERCVAGLAAEQAAEHALDEADVRVPPLPTLPLLKKLA